METYQLVKIIHMSAAVLTLASFLLRGYWMLKCSPLLVIKPVKILPHIIDTVLLASAIYMVVVSQQYPTLFNWVTAKIILLVVYIIAGTMALKNGKTRNKRIIALLIAVASVLGIFALAAIKPAF